MNAVDDAARNAVENAGLTPGTVAFENALIDFLLTDDVAFIESSSTQTAPAPENSGSAGTLDPGETRVTLSVSLNDEGGAITLAALRGTPSEKLADTLEATAKT